jgi:hypothetical protein
MPNLLVLKLLVKDEDGLYTSLQRMKQRDDSYLWAILKGEHSVMNREGEWEYQPLPSSRDNAFLKRTRFSTAMDALKVYRQQETKGESLQPGEGLEYPRDVKAIPCPVCSGYADRVPCTKNELKQYNCGRSTECCARAFLCRVCGSRTLGKAEAPEMMY